MADYETTTVSHAIKWGSTCPICSETFKFVTVTIMCDKCQEALREIILNHRNGKKEE
jgi:bacterioferritin-associated ferredoxin